jgi:2,4-dienoyl-CoA reductase-like NADH-dependent reductase (Old Yellow Enzyme family)/thioredoxin reductase
MTDAVHQYDVKFGMQLMHAGSQADHREKVAPSAIAPRGMVAGVPRELTLPEIGDIVKAFGDAAQRCKQAGFDFVCIHAAHGYLFNQFLAPYSNKRLDKYGGGFENRVRFLLEVLRDIKEKTGPDFPVGVRINGEDYIKDGWTIEDMKRIAPLLEKEGANYLHVSAGVYGSFPITIPSMYADWGCFAHLAAEVKKEVSIPVIAIGRIKNPQLADQIIKEGKADMVAMGRAHLADPEIANKAQSGKIADIRPCLGCCLGCQNQVALSESASCVMNPEVNREYLFKGQEKLTTPKKILVVGAGPAGLAVSRMAALRGHKVIICEERGYIGGMLRLAAVPPRRSELMDLVEYYQKELDTLHVEIRLNVNLDKQLIDSINPDAVVLATGSVPKIPQIEGLFDTEMEIHGLVDVLKGDSLLGDRVIVLGGDQAGLEVADFLAEKGKKIVVLHQEEHFATEMPANDRTYLRERLKRPSVQLYKNVVIKQFLPKGLIFRSGDKEISVNDIEDLVISNGMRYFRKAKDLFEDRHVEFHIIGDAKSPRNLLYSQTEADELGRSI